MTTPDGEEITFAENYGYRTDQDSIDRILLNRNTGTGDYVDDVELTDLKIYHMAGAPAVEIREVTSKSDTLTVSVSADNLPDSAAVYVVSYDADGAALDFESAVLSDGDAQANIPAADVKTVKVFCWESLNSMRPLCKAAEKTL